MKRLANIVLCILLIICVAITVGCSKSSQHSNLDADVNESYISDDTSCDEYTSLSKSEDDITTKISFTTTAALVENEKNTVTDSSGEPVHVTTSINEDGDIVLFTTITDNEGNTVTNEDGNSITGIVTVINATSTQKAITTTKSTTIVTTKSTTTAPATSTVGTTTTTATTVLTTTQRITTVTTTKVTTTTTKKVTTTTADNSPVYGQDEFFDYDGAYEICGYVNQLRIDLGLNELNINESLMEAARVRAKELATSFSHTRPNGLSGQIIIAEYLPNAWYTGENIGMTNYYNAEYMYNLFFDSTGQRILC